MIADKINAPLPLSQPKTTRNTNKRDMYRLSDIKHMPIDTLVEKIHIIDSRMSPSMKMMRQKKNYLLYPPEQSSTVNTKKNDQKAINVLKMPNDLGHMNMMPRDGGSKVNQIESRNTGNYFSRKETTNRTSISSRHTSNNMLPRHLDYTSNNRKVDANVRYTTLASRNETTNKPVNLHFWEEASKFVNRKKKSGELSRVTVKSISNAYNIGNSGN